MENKEKNMTLSELFRRYNFHDGTALLQRETPGQTMEICFALAGWDQSPEVMRGDPDAKSKCLIVQALFHGCSDFRIIHSTFVPAEKTATDDLSCDGEEKEHTEVKGTWVDTPITYAERDCRLGEDEILLNPTDTLLTVYTHGDRVWEEVSFSAQSVEVKEYYASWEETWQLYEKYRG